MPDEKTPIGARVHVMDLNQNDLGLGTYRGDVSFDEAGGEIEAIPNAGPFEATPKIELDSGKIVYGAECFWSETDDNFEVVLAGIEKFGKPIN